MKQSTKTEHKTKEPKRLPDDQELLVQTVEGHYGLEYAGDKEKFVEDAIRKVKDFANAKEIKDPRDEGKFAEKVDELRIKWEGETQSRETAEQKALRKAVEDEELPVSLTFPDEKSWSIRASGKEDTGNMTAGSNGVIASARRMLSIQE